MSIDEELGILVEFVQSQNMVNEALKGLIQSQGESIQRLMSMVNKQTEALMALDDTNQAIHMRLATLEAAHAGIEVETSNDPK
jgi:hypothetical protein